MTKRDVMVWFCKIVAIVGVISALSGLLNIGLMRFFINWGYLGGFGASLLPPVLSLFCYSFIWIFAVGIGESLLIPGEKDDLLTVKSGLHSLFLRSVGLWLFFSNAIAFSPTLLFYAYQKLAAPTSSTPALARISSNSDGLIVAHLIAQFSGIVLGFLLSFTPRLRALLRK